MAEPPRHTPSGHSPAPASDLLAGLALPEAWQGARQWRLLSVGPDAHLHFLHTWAALRADGQRPGMLHVVSLDVDAPQQDKLDRLAAGHPGLRPLAAQLSGQLKGLLPGIHRLAFEGGRVLLTLCIGPVVPLLREQDLEVDSLVLHATSSGLSAGDPFLLKALARCCRRGTRLAIRAEPEGQPALVNALARVGFLAEPATQPGDQAMLLAARFEPPWQPRKSRDPNRSQVGTPGHCTVIGAGLAGAACAASLARRGWRVTVLDRCGPASGASGLPAGIMAPHVSPDDSLISRLSRAGIRATTLEAQRLLEAGQGWGPTGVLQRRLDDTSALPTDWPPPGRDWSEEAGPSHAALAGATPSLASGSLWHACGAWIRPARLVQAWLSEPGIESRALREVGDLRLEPDGRWHLLDAAGEVLLATDLVVVAAGPACQDLLSPLLARRGISDASLPLQAIRGQVSWGAREDDDALPAVPVNGVGNLVPSFPSDLGQAWMMGATFDRDDLGTALRAESSAQLFDKLSALWPPAAQSLKSRFEAGALEGWAGVRCASRDHLPVVGPLLPDKLPGLWVATAFGSRGLSYSALCGELIAAWLHDEPLPLEPRLAQAIQASRLLRRR